MIHYVRTEEGGHPVIELNVITYLSPNLCWKLKHFYWFQKCCQTAEHVNNFL